MNALAQATAALNGDSNDAEHDALFRLLPVARDLRSTLANLIDKHDTSAPDYGDWEQARQTLKEVDAP